MAINIEITSSSAASMGGVLTHQIAMHSEIQKAFRVFEGIRSNKLQFANNLK